MREDGFAPPSEEEELALFVFGEVRVFFNRNWPLIDLAYCFNSFFFFFFFLLLPLLAQGFNCPWNFVGRCFKIVIGD